MHRDGQQAARSNQNNGLKNAGNIEVEHWPILSARPAADDSTLGKSLEMGQGVPRSNPSINMGFILGSARH
jgi:hypothetical protein